jgi:hypothetical protein
VAEGFFFAAAFLRLRVFLLNKHRILDRRDVREVERGYVWSRCPLCVLHMDLFHLYVKHTETLTRAQSLSAEPVQKKIELRATHELFVPLMNLL